jgi:predicted negative regulator of RcsB-dependent stress response
MGTSATPSNNDGIDADSIRDWFASRGRPVAYVAAAGLAAVAIGFFYKESVLRKNERAEAALATAQSAFYAGNAALAKSDLEKVVTRYAGTPGGTQATMLLAQILYGEGKYEDGINRLTSVVGSAPAPMAAAVEELLGSGYADAKKYDQAIEHFNKAADKAEFATGKAMYRAEAARIMQLTGKNAEARKVWEALMNDPESPVISEARVRIGEIDAKAAIK